MVKLFERILVQGDPSFNVLDEMLDTRILSRFIPEFGSIVNRIQFDEYHLYPVDKHSLHAVLTVQRWRNNRELENEPICAEVYAELEKPALLHWAVLLHDVGKGEASDDHSVAGEKLIPQILGRIGYKQEDIDTVAFLVKEHLLLAKTATRRDINDEETCLFCAQRIKNTQRLRMLYLLTVADSISTGPNAWNQWTASLLRNLFVKTFKIIETGELASDAAIEIAEEKKTRIRAALLANHVAGNVEKAVNVLSPRYLLSVAIEDIVSHIDLNTRRGEDPVLWEVVKNPASNSRTVTICAKDSPGLFSKIAGVFTLNSIDILNVQVFTWRNFTALDVFEVKPPPDPVFEDEKWGRAFHDLANVVSGKLDIPPALEEKMASSRTIPAKIQERPCRVKVDNDSSSFFTIIEVFAYDFPGLLFNITHALFALGLDVWVAKIATKIDQVVDVFYVRDFDGQKIDSDEQEKMIKEKIASVITLPD